MLALAKYVLTYRGFFRVVCFSLPGVKIQSFHDNLYEVFKNNKDGFIAFNFTVSDLGCHSYRNGAATFCASACIVAPITGASVHAPRQMNST